MMNLTLKSLIISLCILFTACRTQQGEEENVPNKTKSEGTAQEALDELTSALSTSAKQFAEKNSTTRELINSKILEEVRNGNTKAKDFQPVMKEIDSMTIEMIKYLDGVIFDLEKLGKQDPDTKELEDKKALGKSQQYFFGRAGDFDSEKSKANDIREQFQDYHEWAIYLLKDQGANADQLNELIEAGIVKPFSPLRIDESPGSDPKEMTWEEAVFSNKPLIAHLAMMEKFRLDIDEIQSQLYHFIALQVSAYTLQVDSLLLKDVPESPRN